MSDSTQNLDTISVAQSQKEATANALFDAASAATIFGRRASTCSGLVFGYYGGRFNGTSVANGTVTATASNTNYVVAHRTTLAVTVATSSTNWNDTATYGRMYKLTAGGSSVTSYEDHRFGADGILGGGTLADSGVTPGVYGDTSNVPQITVDAQGRVTDVTEIAITGGGGGGGGSAGLAIVMSLIFGG
jgi:hypothetical protein